MITFIVSVILLILGYVVYGKITEKVFGIDDNRIVPSQEFNDGVDFVPLPTWKACLIQFLNIAGTGPIFGAIAGAMWGSSAFLWIVFGCIFGGAVNDFMCGMLSIRSKGCTMISLTGENLGKTVRHIMTVFLIVLLLLLGVVFISSPADLLADLTGLNKWIFIVCIFAYYLLATILPIDKVIGKIYPVFGVALLIMAVGILFGMINSGLIAEIPEISFANQHITGKSIFPYLFISIACGAISGFHTTQSPLMARCLRTEKDGRRVFYGAMIAEGLVALIWAAAAMTFFGGLEGLSEAGTAAVVVNKISLGLLGPVGMVLAVLGVVACPITSGDTAFRSLRLSIAEIFNLDQKSNISRYKIVIPVFLLAACLLFVDFDIIWRYFSWSNQTLATIALWTTSAYLKKNGKKYIITIIPAIFMTVVVTCYIIVADEGFYYFVSHLVASNHIILIGEIIGVLVSLLSTILFFKKIKSPENKIK